MNKIYDHTDLNKNWQVVWKKKKQFLPNYNNNNKYCITIPPPNITGKLHMGHAFQCTLMDILIRYYKMNGYCTLWKLGTDHAGIASQILIEQKFKCNNKSTLQKYSLKWKKRGIIKIKNQIDNLGFLVNWNTSRFTLDKHFCYAVKTAFIKLYNENLIYKSKKIVNWDTKLKTAISDLETIYKKTTSQLFYIKYKIHNSNNNIIIATTRPETIFADTAIAINPNDIRYKHLINKKIIVPIINKIIPIIVDEAVDINFGTGCLKITPAHDFSDFEIGQKHQLPIINIFNKNGTLNQNASKHYINLTIEIAKKKIVNDLTQADLIYKVETYENKIPYGDRSGSIIEPLLTTQWYIKTKPLILPVKNIIQNDKIKIIPIKWKKIFIDWINNIKDWCISRQIWWGHKIPIWYDTHDNEYVGQNIQHIIQKYNLDKTIVLRQDVNILDTWFSSALWPFASLGWPKNSIEFKCFYPTNTLITGFDIIFFWVIRMIMFSIKFTNQIPFKEIYVHGLLRDHKGTKMSKTKGNVIDPMDIINGISKKDLIKKQITNLMTDKVKKDIINNINTSFPAGIKAYGNDSLRLMLSSISTDSMSLKIDLKKFDKYKNFCNKIWNASKFLIFVISANDVDIFNRHTLYDTWINLEWDLLKKKIKINIEQRNFFLANNNIYNFFWNEFCDWYIEITKILYKLNKYRYNNKKNIKKIFKEFLILLHPFAPIITEEIWYNIYDKHQNILFQNYPVSKHISNIIIIKKIIKLKNICTIIRKNKQKIVKNNKLSLFFKTYYDLNQFEYIQTVIKKILKINNIIFSKNILYNNNYNFKISNDILIIIKNYIKANETIKLKQINKILKQIKGIETTLQNKLFIQNVDKNIINKKIIKVEQLKIKINNIKNT